MERPKHNLRKLGQIFRIQGSTRLLVLSSDGNSTIEGNMAEIATRLEELRTEIVTVPHCHNHRLEVAAKNNIIIRKYI